MNSDSVNIGHLVFIFSFFLWVMTSVVFEIMPPYLVYSCAAYFNFIKLRLIQWNRECEALEADQPSQRNKHFRKLSVIVQDHIEVIR